MISPREVPPWPTFLRPLLEVLNDGQIWKTSDLESTTTDRMRLSDEQRAQTLKSGQTQAYNRVGWALSALTRAQAVQKVRLGESRITDVGIRLLEDHPAEITEADLEVIPAYRDHVPQTRAAQPVTVDSEQLPSYWFVGAAFDGTRDQTENFRASGTWVNDNSDRYLDLVKDMKPGERIAIKATFTRKHELPFDAKGNRASVMTIKATGTVKRNHGDGHNIDVDWDPPLPWREWYFYTNQRTVWRVREDDWKTRALIDFTFNGAEQDHAVFRNAPFWSDRFGDAAPVVEEEGEDETDEEEKPGMPVYQVADIVADGCFLPEEAILKYLDALERKKNLIVQGPPGTGKTWLAKRLARALIGSGPSDLLQSVQFHPTLSYEDFVRGWRPSGDGKLDLVDGLFLDIVNKAESNPGNKHVLVIEEINRGNLAQIFGELLTLLEADKRDPAEALTLTYRRPGDGPVHIPPNLYIIGTMNLADRSLAIVDFALRRRFGFANLEPQFNQSWRDWVSNRNGIDAGFLSSLANRIALLNEKISADRSLGDQYRIGHSFFTPTHDRALPDQHKWVQDVVEQEIRPLLMEYWFDDPQRVEAEANALTGLP